MEDYDFSGRVTECSGSRLCYLALFTAAVSEQRDPHHTNPEKETSKAQSLPDTWGIFCPKKSSGNGQQNQGK
jgi:hypothetical protein